MSAMQPEFRVLEGTNNIATITVLRDVNVYSGAMTLGYATSDLSAMGVDPTKFADCLGIPTNM